MPFCIGQKLASLASLFSILYFFAEVATKIYKYMTLMQKLYIFYEYTLN